MFLLFADGYYFHEVVNELIYEESIVLESTSKNMGRLININDGTIWSRYTVMVNNNKRVSKRKLKRVLLKLHFVKVGDDISCVFAPDSISIKRAMIKKIGWHKNQIESLLHFIDNVTPRFGPKKYSHPKLMGARDRSLIADDNIDPYREYVSETYEETVDNLPSDIINYIFNFIQSYNLFYCGFNHNIDIQTTPFSLARKIQIISLADAPIFTNWF